MSNEQLFDGFVGYCFGTGEERALVVKSKNGGFKLLKDTYKGSRN